MKSSQDRVERTYRSTEAAALALGVQTSSVENAILHGSISISGTNTVYAARRVPNASLAGEFLVAEPHALPHKATVVSTAGRVSHSPTGHLRFGRKYYDEARVERRKCGRHQLSREILLIVDPFPEGDDPDNWQVDHINRNALDNRWCNLQWMRVKGAKVNEHSDKSTHERRERLH